VLQLAVRVHPRSSRNVVRMVSSGQVEVWTTAPPADGRANDAVCKLIAEWLGVAGSDVSIVAGARGRTKTIKVAGVQTLPQSERCEPCP
jgi:uncharacterized protein